MIDDKQCLKNIAQGSESDLEVLYVRFAKPIFNTILNYTRNQEDAEEVLQDVFVTVYKKADSFNFDSSVNTWIYRIAVNKSLDFLRKKKSAKRFGIFTSLYKKDSAEIKFEIKDFNHPGIRLENKEDAGLLFNAIETLAENQQTAFILSQIDGLPHAEIADIIGVSRKAVESLIQRAKQNLRKALEKHFPERRKSKKNSSNK